MTRRPRIRCRKKRVVEILRAYHAMGHQESMRLVKRWDRWVTSQCRGRLPASLIAWGLVRISAASTLTPSARRRSASPPGKSTLVQGRRIVRSYPSRNVAVRAAKRFVERTGRPVDILTPNPVARSRRRTGRRLARDAENPFKGEIFETKAGQRWEVVEVSDKRITVRRIGSRPRSTGPLVWGRGSLKFLKPVDRFKLSEEKATEKPLVKPEPVRGGLFGFGLPISPDPDGRRRGKGSRKNKKTPRRRASSTFCSSKPLLARKRMLESGQHPPHAGKGPSKVQSLVFERHCWTTSMAKAWARKHGYRVVKTDITPTEIRIRQRAPSSMKIVGSMPFKRGLRAVLGFPKRKRVKR